METAALPQPPPQVQMRDGTFVAAQTSFNRKEPPKRFLIVLSYYEGDREEAEELAGLIADLERIRDRGTDVMLFARADAGPFSPTVKTRLEAKFGKVVVQKCRRKDGKGYPFGPNSMFADLVTLFAQYTPWNEYYAFANLEPDSVPLRPGWIGELTKAYRLAEAEGKSILGYVHSDPVRHCNGVGIWSIDIWRRVGANTLGGGSPQVPYDVWHAETLLPFAEHTDLIRFEYRRPTITADELFAERNGVVPALFHGVRDASAREAVRARYVTFSEHRDVSRKTVFTFVGLVIHTDPAEDAKIRALWEDGWRSRGWNPVILSTREAARSPRYKTFLAAVEKLPFIGEKLAANHRFVRWMALDVLGGGFMTDIDVLPGAFTPDDITRRDVALVLSARASWGISAALFDRAHLATFLAAIEAYNPTPDDMAGDRPCVTDATIFAATWPDAFEPTVVEYSDPVRRGSAKLVRFERNGVAAAMNGARQSVAMEQFLRGS